MDVSDVVISSPSAKSTVHGILVGEISPLKTSRKRNDLKFFDGKFSWALLNLSRSLLLHNLSSLSDIAVKTTHATTCRA